MSPVGPHGPATVKWRLFKGFNPPSAEACWIPPCCSCRGSSILRMPLSPWIDWWGIGCIGYCQGCARYYLVTSEWEQIPGTHLKEERQRLIGHELTEIEFRKSGLDQPERLWQWHEELPHDGRTLEEVNALRLKLPGGNEETVLLQYLLWTIIWNADVTAEHLLVEFFEFSLLHPQYLTLGGRTVWLGHEVDLAEALERRYQDKVPNSLFEMWRKHRPSVKQFRAGLGYYIPSADSGISAHGEEFRRDAVLSRKRIALQQGTQEGT